MPLTLLTEADIEVRLPKVKPIDFIPEVIRDAALEVLAESSITDAPISALLVGAMGSYYDDNMTHGPRTWVDGFKETGQSLSEAELDEIPRVRKIERLAQSLLDMSDLSDGETITITVMAGLMLEDEEASGGESVVAALQFLDGLSPLHLPPGIGALIEQGCADLQRGEAAILIARPDGPGWEATTATTRVAGAALQEAAPDLVARWQSHAMHDLIGVGRLDDGTLAVMTGFGDDPNEGPAVVLGVHRTVATSEEGTSP